MKKLEKIFSGTWKDDLKNLPKYQKDEILKASKILKEIERYKFDTITFNELKNNLRSLIK
jgi:hypothetical protein